MRLTATQYETEEAAREYLESQLWPNGPVCPHCRAHNDATKMNREEGAARHGRNGLYQCRKCRGQFTITIGTIFEDSKIPLHKSLLAIHLMCSSTKGVSALQLQRELKLGSYRSAWFLCRRIRWAMTQPPMVLALNKLKKQSGVVD
jgi:transposase-like protein